MFWKLSFRQPSAIDTLLDKDDVTLHEILDEDDVLQECKTQNKKLVDFLARPENLEQLVVLISQEPENDVEDKVKFKYPHVACELLTSEVFTIVEQLSSDEHLLGLLWAFLDSPNALNPLVGSFISKVLGMLLSQKASVILEFIRGKEEFLSLFLGHLGTSAMMDFLLQMVAAPDNDQSRIDLAMWLKEQGIVDRLVDFLRPTANPEQCVNASLALCDMIRLSREAAQMAAPSPLLGTLESEETIRRMLDNMFCADTPSDVVIVNGIAVLLTALEKRPNNVLSPALNRSFAPGEDGAVAVDNTQSIDQILSVVLPRLTDFHSLLTRRPDVPPMVTTIGTLDPPLGNTRLQVVRLFSTLLHCCDVTTSKEIMRLKTFDVLMDLFFEFPWNNFLHAQVECCINAALHSPVVLNCNNEGTENGESVAQNPTSLRHYLLAECQLVHRLLKMGERNDAICSQPGGQRQGYMGHMIRIVNNITQSEEGEERLQDVMKEALDEDTQRQWSDFLSGPVAEMNMKNDTNLGGSRPLASSMDDSDEEFDQLGGGPDSELEKAYQQFQDVKYTTSMMEDYGVDDELNVVQEPFGATFTRLMDINCKITADEEPSQSAAMFETACSERIQQFDDSESDEEESSTWAEKDVSFVSPVDHQSMSSDEDEENSERRPRELQTGSSDEDDRSPTGRAALYHTKIPSITRNEQESDTMEIDETIGVITWRSELSTDEDLTGVVAMDTGGGMTDWTKEPEPTVSSPGSRWADFSAFSARNEQDMTPQDMELETSLEASEITVGDVSENPNQSPERHDTSQYSPLSPASGGEGEEQASPLAVDNIEVSVTRSESSEEEEDASSDSDEERSGSYRLNESTGSEKELLLTSSPAQTTSLGQEEVVVGSPVQNRGNQEPAASSGSETVLQEQTGNSTTPPGHELAANGLPPEIVKGNEEQKDSDTSQSLRPDPLDGSGVRENANENCDKVPDGEVEENELQDNFSFLSQQGLLSEDGSRSKPDNHNLIEEKRAEALEACALYEQEVQGQTET